MNNKKVYIFKDIKNNRWTVYDFESKKHIGYRKQVQLENCSFEVIQEKLIKVRNTGNRFPHAWVIGVLVKSSPMTIQNQITYNPFKDKSFKCNNKIIKKAKKVSFLKNGQVFV